MEFKEKADHREWLAVNLLPIRTITLSALARSGLRFEDKVEIESNAILRFLNEGHQCKEYNNRKAYFRVIINNEMYSFLKVRYNRTHTENLDDYQAILTRPNDAFKEVDEALTLFSILSPTQLKFVKDRLDGITEPLSNQHKSTNFRQRKEIIKRLKEYGYGPTK